MPETFVISPSEALLLGLCLEEYLCYQAENESPPRCHFLDIVRSRLMPHVKTSRRLQIVEIAPEHCPTDIEWSGLFGRSRSCPEQAFISKDAEAGVTAFQYDLSRRSLLDSLVSALWDHVSRSFFDRYFLAPTQRELATAIFESFTQPDLTYSSFERQGSESTATIQNFIEDLIKTNEYDHVFAVGRRFGKLVYAIDDFESFVWSIEERYEQMVEGIRGEIACDELIKIDEEHEAAAQKEFEEWFGSNLKSLLESQPPDASEEEWFETVKKLIEDKKEEIFVKYGEWAEEEARNYEWPPPDEIKVDFRPHKQAAISEATKALLDSDVIRRCLHAQSLLERLLEIGGRLVFDLTQDSEVTSAQRVTISHVADARMALWLAFGEVLGALQYEDKDAQLAAAESLTSRAFPLSQNDTPDRVFDRLRGVEVELNSRSDITPEEIVERLGNCIEALARRVWPTDFSATSYGGELSVVLLGRVREDTKNSAFDRRFAAIALSLKQYRNPSQHGLDTFKCSFEEARFFLAGIRALVDLWKRWPKNRRERRRLR